MRWWNRYDNLSFVTPSSWLGSCVQQSKLAKSHKVFVVPNVVNTDIFKPMNIDAKGIFGLSKGKKRYCSELPLWEVCIKEQNMHMIV